MAKYKFSDRLMFAIVMHDESLCRQFIERLFPEKKVKKIGMLTSEKAIINGLKSKSVRLDVMFEDDKNIYDIEMQVTERGNLPKRARYYHSSMDVQTLKRGEEYDKLKQSYVIFICMFDLYGLGEPIYRFERYDRNLGLQMGDESFTIMLDVTCPREKVPKALEPFFTYVKDEIVEDDEFIAEIHEKVEKANHDAEVIEIMTLDEDYRMWNSALKHETEMWKARAKESYAEGEQSGIEKGKQSVIEKMRASGMSEEQIAQILE